MELPALLYSYPIMSLLPGISPSAYILPVTALVESGSYSRRYGRRRVYVIPT